MSLNIGRNQQIDNRLIFLEAWPGGEPCIDADARYLTKNKCGKLG